MVSVQAEIETAAQELVGGNLQLAESMCRRITANTPEERALRANLLGLILGAQGRADDALAEFRSAYGLWPAHAGICFNLGRALANRGSIGEALACFERAASLAPDHPEVHLMLGAARETAGQPAIASYRRAVELDPDNAPARDGLVRALFQAGDFVAAHRILGESLAARPDDAGLLHNRGLARHQLGRHDEAIDDLRHALSLAPGRAETHYVLGSSLRERGDYEGAVASLATAAALAPDDARIHYRLGQVHARMKDAERAAASLRRALELDPKNASAQHELGLLLKQQARLDEAAAHLQWSLELRPDAPDVINELGVIHRLQGRFDDAERCFRRHLELRPGSAGVHKNLGNIHMERGEVDQAYACYERTLAIDPSDAGARWNKAHIQLLKGDFTEGWRLFESRWQLEDASPPLFAQPQWRGEPLEGRTILLHVEQGLGDILQFVRYVPLVARRGGRVVLTCPAPVRRLLAPLEGVSQIVNPGEPAPPFDFHCPLMSLPLAFGTDLRTIPCEIPYLRADDDAAARWKARIGEHRDLAVGLVWAGSGRQHDAAANSMDRRRSVALAALAPLTGVAGVRFFSLQKGDPAEQASAAPAGMVLIDHTRELDDFADTAALVANLDLVVTVDTSVAHLAGGMGKPVWMLSRLDGCWRWLLDREDSPWYPTMRIFRQRVRGNWDKVVEELAAALRELVSARGKPV